MTKKDFAVQYGNGVRATIFTVTFADLQAISGSGAQPITLADADNPLKLFTIPQYSRIMSIMVKTSVAFTGGSLSGMTMSLGVTGAVTRFTAAYNIFQTIGDTVLQETASPASGQYSTINAIIATFTPTADTLANCTAGQLEIEILWAEVTSTPNGLLPA